MSPVHYNGTRPNTAGLYNGEDDQQHHGYYPNSAASPYAPVEDPNASTYSFNAAGTPGAFHDPYNHYNHNHPSSVDVSGTYGSYEDGERSPLTAHAAPLAGQQQQQQGYQQQSYPPAPSSAPSPFRPYDPASQQQHPSPHHHPSFLKHDPYGYSHPSSMMDSSYNLPPAGFSAAAASARPPSSRADSELDWQRRARMPTRGKTMKVKLTQGNFVNDYPVPNPIKNSVEAKWLAGCE